MVVSIAGQWTLVRCAKRLSAMLENRRRPQALPLNSDLVRSTLQLIKREWRRPSSDDLLIGPRFRGASRGDDVEMIRIVRIAL